MAVNRSDFYFTVIKLDGVTRESLLRKNGEKEKKVEGRKKVRDSREDEKLREQLSSLGMKIIHKFEDDRRG